MSDEVGATAAWKKLRGYAGPSDPRRTRMSSFLLRKFWGTHLSLVEPHLTRGRRRWFDQRRVDRRSFEVYYGYNPRCCHQGTYGKPGFGPWKNGLRARYYYYRD